MMSDEPKLRPNGAGAKLWAWLEAQIENLEELRPLAVEICVVADRLEQVRTAIAEQGLTVCAARGRTTKNSLLDVELKLSKALAGLWRSMGLADKSSENPDDVVRRPVGRPSGLWQG